MDTITGNKQALVAAFIKVLVCLIICVFSCTGVAFGDSTQYFYDDLGRLARVVKGTSGVVYTYDTLGNPVSTVAATTANGSPSISGIAPNTLFVGSRMLVRISGLNLLTTDTVIATGGLVDIDIISVSDTQITAEMTALSAGNDTIRVTTRSGGTATINVVLSSSTLIFNPNRLVMQPGTNGTLNASISPPLANPLTIYIENDFPSVASVPQSISIPAGGSTNFNVTALQSGTTEIYSGISRAVVIVSSPFSGDISGLASSGVSVFIDSPSGTSPINTKALSVAVDTPSGTAPATTAPVSVMVDAPYGTAPATTPPVSVVVDALLGESVTTSGGVSVLIQ